MYKFDSFMFHYFKISHFFFRSIVLFLVGLTSLYARGQADVRQNISNNFNNYQQNHLQEKLFTHTDRSFYVAGEVLWFSIYCMDGTTHQLLALSKVAYVELLDKGGIPVLQAKTPLDQGTGNGSLSLPISMQTGNYRFRAYTHWMKNGEADFYFEKDITVVNTLQKDTLTAPVKETGNASVQFFPEGGYLVQGLNSKVAFQVTDTLGRSIAAEGILLSATNDTIIRFHTLKSGIGTFAFTPQNNATYKAVLHIADGRLLTKELPPVQEQGYVLQVSDAEDGNTVHITAQTTTGEGIAYLLIHTGQQIKTAETIVFSNGTARFQLNKAAIGEGISHIMLFNNRQQPVCERLYFKKPSSVLYIHAQPDQQQYATRKKVTLTIFAKNEKGEPAPSRLSMAVFRLDSLSFLETNTIYHYLWLTSDLSGVVE
ncbi:MAG: hypothetical protein ICV79_24745 [Flavisolibacter sp.]|nr:hypothetical protein [Flavisolibacter sp.]